MTISEAAKGFVAYPKPREGPTTPYHFIPGSNPILSGLPLAIASSAAVNVPGIASILWNNAGLSGLRKVTELIDYEARYEPVVIRNGSETGTDLDFLKSVDDRYSKSKTASPYTSIGDFHAAYKAGKTTPTKVVKLVLDLMRKEPHKTAFLSVKSEEVIAGAEASSQRWREGIAKSVLDGVPIAVKGRSCVGILQLPKGCMA